jgi:hypothetical protein
MVDSVEKKFFVPQDRVDEMVSIIERMLVEGFCTLRMLEKCVGKCRSMAIAVPCAILYTRAQYAALASNLDHKRAPRIARSKTICIQPGSELAQELNMWLQLQTKLVNGAVWMEVAKVYLNLHAFMTHHQEDGVVCFVLHQAFSGWGVISQKRRLLSTLMKRRQWHWEILLNYFAQQVGT